MKINVPPAEWTDTYKPTPREIVLDKARNCVCGQREEDYGTPEDNFSRIADYWTEYLDTLITPLDVANMMILLKIARTQGGRPTLDSYVDIAGYAACAGEIMSAEQPASGTKGTAKDEKN